MLSLFEPHKFVLYKNIVKILLQIIVMNYFLLQDFSNHVFHGSFGTDFQLMLSLEEEEQISTLTVHLKRNDDNKKALKYKYDIILHIISYKTILVGFNASHSTYVIWIKPVNKRNCSACIKSCKKLCFWI